MTTKNVKVVLFASLIVALILPFSVMDISAESKVAPRLLTPQDVEKLAPEYLKLEQDLQAMTSKTKVASQAEIESVANKLLAIHERVAEHKEAAKIANHIPEKQKLKMEIAVVEITESDLPWTMVGIDTKTKTVRVAISGDESIGYYQKQVKDIISTNVPITIVYGEYLEDLSCTTQTSDCDPIVGGIQINDGNNCTLSLEVYTGPWYWPNWGFLTAGHCYAINDLIDQPSGGGEIGKVTVRDFVHNGDCDCEFIDKTTSTNSDSKIWISSNTYKSVTSKGDASVDDYVLTSLSKTGGTDWGQVTYVEQSRQNTSGVVTTGLTIMSGISATSGDSGAPVMELFGNQYHGILKGATAFSPWSNIAPSLGVS